MKRNLLIIVLGFISLTVYSQECLKTDGSNSMKGQLIIDKKDTFAALQLKSEVGCFIDFTSDYTSDYNARIIWNQNKSNRFDIWGNTNFFNSVTIEKYFRLKGHFALDNPNRISDWNTVWQSVFFESYNASNAPESSGWFWGMNLNHGSNKEDYRYNGQIAIKNSSSNPTLYFRSTGKEGTGTWAKVINSHGNQTIDGGLTLNGKLLSKEVKVQANIEVPDYVFKDDYNLRSLNEVKAFIEENSHLPDVPSEKVLNSEGINVGEMNLILLKKIEELTLYTIKQEKLIESQQEEINELKKLQEEIHLLKELILDE